MIAESKAYSKFKTLATQSLQNLSANVIVKVKNDYIVFDRYTITPVDGEFKVFRHEDYVHNFTCSRNALAYCILEQNGRIGEAEYLVRQDKKLQYLQNDIEYQSHIMRTTQDKDKQELMAIKVTHNILARTEVKDRLQATIGLAKYYQQKGFDNETARVSKK